MTAEPKIRPRHEDQASCRLKKGVLCGEMDTKQAREHTPTGSIAERHEFASTARQVARNELVGLGKARQDSPELFSPVIADKASPTLSL